MSYAQARKDFEFLETLTELYDQVELDAMRIDLMRNPTKAFAERMYQAAIRMWFEEQRLNGRDWPNHYYRVIAARYGITISNT